MHTCIHIYIYTYITADEDEGHHRRQTTKASALNHHRPSWQDKHQLAVQSCAARRTYKH